MKKTRKAIASLAIASMALTTVPFNALAADVPLRIAGNTASDTAVEISKQTGWSGAAILASSESYGMADALAAGPLAFYLKAPILLTNNSATLDAATKAELSRLNVSTVYVTSGTAVIPQAVLNEISAMNITVVPLGGYDRAETSVNIAKRMTGVTKVAVANSVPDALSIASIASAANQPILLVDKDNVSSSVKDYVADGITSADVIGGTGVISDATANQFPSATRHFGYTAYDTNNQVIQDFADALNFDIVYTANGATAIDALSGAPLAAQTKSPIVLTDGQSVPAAAAFVSSKLSENGQVTALGGTAVISESIRQGIKDGQVNDVTGPLAVTSVTANTASSIKVVFNKAPQDVEKMEFEVLQGQNAVTLSTEWNAAKTEVTLSKSTKFVEGSYTVSVKNDGVELQNSTLAFTEQKVAKIDIYSKTLGVVNQPDKDPTQLGYASYRVLDQYGDNITKSAIANNVNFQTGVGSIEAKNGLIKVEPTSSLNLLTFSGGVVITANDTTSGVSTTATLEVTSRVGTLSDFQLKKITNENGKTEVVAGDTTEVFYIEYEALDIGGEPTTNYTIIKEGLILSGDNDDELITSSPYVTAKLVQDPADSDKGLIEMKAEVWTENDLLQVDMPLVVTAMSWAGSNSQLTTTLRKQAQVDTISLYAPSESVASGESKRIPFAAYDQNGDAVTKYTDLESQVTVTGAKWYEDLDGSGYLKNDVKYVSATSTTSLPHTISASTKTGKFSNITINIQKPVKADNMLLNSTILMSTLQEGGAYQFADMGWDKGGFIVRDQYDRVMDMTRTDYSNYRILATSTNPDAIKVAVGRTTTDPDAATTTSLYSASVNFDANGDYIYVKSFAAGSSTVRFELQLGTTTDGTTTWNTIDSKSQTFTSIKNDDIKDYMVDQLTKPIYMVNGEINNGGINDKVSAQEDEFKARPKAYGTTSSGGKVVLKGNAIMTVGVDNDDFIVYDKQNKGWVSDTGTTVNVWDGNRLLYDEIRIVANKLTDDTKTESEAVVNVVIEAYDGKVYNRTTPITSSKTRPSATSIKVGIASERDGIRKNDEGDEVTIDLATFKTNGTATGSVTSLSGLGSLYKFDYKTGEKTAQNVYFAPIDQYGSQGSKLAGLYIVSQKNGTTDLDYKLKDGFIVANDGSSDVTFKAGDQFKVTATTSSGLTRSIWIYFTDSTTTN